MVYVNHKTILFWLIYLIWVLLGDEYWKLTDDGVEAGYPKKISTWGLPNNLDAAFTWTNGKTYFFKVNPLNYTI